MIRRLIGSAILVLAATAGTAIAQAPAAPAPPSVANARANSRDAAPEIFRTWVDARAGTGEPVHWVSDGGVFAYPSGEKLVGMIGFDSSRVIWPDEPGDPVIHLTRKTYAYTDAKTGEILTEFNGQPVEPIAYPYQMITYRYEDGKIYADVEQGAGANVRKIISADGMTTRMMGKDTLVVNAPVFLDFPLPGGKQYQAWENYDFFLHKSGVDEPHQLTWQRYGSPPPFLNSAYDAAKTTDPKAIYHMLSWRVETQDEFPPQILAWAKEAKPQWLPPPTDIAEIRALQTGAEGTGWAK